MVNLLETIKTSVKKATDFLNTGGGTFQNSFLSVAGVKERATNTLEVLKQSLNPFSKEKPEVNSSIVTNPTVKAGLSFLASNPYTTAALVATPASSAGRSAVVSTLSKLSPITKVVAGGTALVATPAILSSEKIRVKATEVASQATPEKLLSLGSDIGKTVDKPTANNLKDLIVDNKVLLGGTAAALLLAGGAKTVSTITNYLNTEAIQDNTKITKELLKEEKKADQIKLEMPKQADQTPVIYNILPANPITETPKVPTSPIKKKVKKKKKKKKNIKRKKYKKKYGRKRRRGNRRRKRGRR